MSLLGRHITDDIHMDGLRLCIPDIEADRERHNVGTDAFGDGDRVGVTLLHGFGELEEQPMIKFTGERMVSIHRL